MPPPGPNERAYERAYEQAYGTCRREARAQKRSKRDDAEREVATPFLFLFIGFV